MTGFPDGAFKSLACPVPVSKLRDLLACHRAMDADPAIKTTIHGFVQLGIGTVNYLEGRNGAFASNPIPLYFHTFDQTGLPPVTLPVWETGNTRSRRRETASRSRGYRKWSARQRVRRRDEDGGFGWRRYCWGSQSIVGAKLRDRALRRYSGPQSF